MCHGWNDEITSFDLELDTKVNTNEGIPVPDENLEEEFNKGNMLTKGEIKND